MAVRIRLTRVGATKRPAYRVIAIDQRRSRDGRALEILGFYDPLTEPATVQLQSERISAWIGKGAQPSDTVVRLMRQAERAAASATPPEKPKRPARPPAKPKAAKRTAEAVSDEPAGAAEVAAPDSAAAPEAEAAPTQSADAAADADETTAASADAPSPEAEKAAAAADGSAPSGENDTEREA